MTDTSVFLGQQSASVFELAIALTATVALCVVLLILLIALCASKNFRTVFFREKVKPGEPTQEAARSQAPIQEATPVQAPVQEAEPPAQKPKRTPIRRKSSASEPAFLDAIPTVPLGAPSVSDVPSEKRSGAYTTRSVTITRARTARKPAEKDDKKD